MVECKQNQKELPNIKQLLLNIHQVLKRPKAIRMVRQRNNVIHTDLSVERDINNLLYWPTLTVISYNIFG